MTIFSLLLNFFQGNIYVHEIHPGGPAEKSGKIKAGYKVTKVNDTDFTKITNSLALECLRGTTEKVRLVCMCLEMMKCGDK